MLSHGWQGGSPLFGSVEPVRGFVSFEDVEARFKRDWSTYRSKQ